MTNLTDDLRYFEEGSELTHYRVYPSLTHPRFIFPEGDAIAGRFLARILEADMKTAGLLGKIVAPFSSLALLVAPRVLLRAPSAELSTLCTQLGMPAPLRFSKFCQHLVTPHTKVLFLATSNDAAHCVIKVMRAASFDGKLRAEKVAQEQAGAVAPKVFGEGVIDGRFAYAEEVVDGMPLSRSEALAREEEIVKLIAALPTGGTVSSSVVADALTPYVPSESTQLMELLAVVRAQDVPLRTGLTHGDLGAPNILVTSNGLRFIDWEHAGERPFYLLDAAQFVARLRRIGLLRQWREEGQAAFVRMTGATKEEADALYALSAIVQTLSRKFRAVYPAAVARLQELL